MIVRRYTHVRAKMLHEKNDGFGRRIGQDFFPRKPGLYKVFTENILYRNSVTGRLHTLEIQLVYLLDLPDNLVQLALEGLRLLISQIHPGKMSHIRNIDLSSIRSPLISHNINLRK